MQKKINFVKLLKGYTGWVGIAPDFSKVLFSGRTLKDVRSKARKNNQTVYVFPAGEVYSDFVGHYDH